MGAMLLEYVQPDNLQPMGERRQAGHDLRRVVPRGQQAIWQPPADRRDPLQILIETSRHHISSLLPIRFGRMRASAFAFFRGSAAVMAADLAATPTSGIWVQSCGDCHLGNFGTYAAADGTPLFDINDFDETLPAPFEWDLKRLATSFAVDARSHGMVDRACRTLARGVVTAYRKHMATLMRLDPERAWRSHVDATAVLQSISDAKLRQRALKRLRTAAEAHRKGYQKLLDRRKSGWRIRPQPPLTFPLSGQNDDTHELVARTAFEAYKLSQPEERGVLLDRYRLVKARQRVGGALELSERVAAIVVNFRKIRVQSERLVIARQGVICLTQRLEDHAEVCQHPNIGRLQAYRFAQMFERFGVQALLKSHQAKLVRRFEMMGLVGEYRPIGVAGFLQLAVLL